jgi:hypothetical protein
MATDAEHAGGRVGQDDVRARGLRLSNEARERALAGERMEFSRPGQACRRRPPTLRDATLAIGLGPWGRLQR